PRGGSRHPPSTGRRSDLTLPLASWRRLAGLVARHPEAFLPPPGNDVPPVSPAATAGGEGDDGKRLLLHTYRRGAHPGGRAKRSLPVCGTGASFDPAVPENSESPGGSCEIEPRKLAPGLR